MYVSCCLLYASCMESKGEVARVYFLFFFSYYNFIFLFLFNYFSFSPFPFLSFFSFHEAGMVNAIDTYLGSSCYLCSFPFYPTFPFSSSRCFWFWFLKR
ncbi:hypothetical protein F4810DRAFT_596973 [Camillea tinctor]|nr:hypothetical protein F4810DRAFT_596973 [Camillea tinctor]